MGMGRTSGYRPKLAQAAEVAVLRERLGTLRGSDWQKATILMRQITLLCGRRGGPMGGQIQPRLCKHCDHFGHTKQFCAIKKSADNRAVAREIDRDAKERDMADWEAKERLERRNGMHLRKGTEELFAELGWEYAPHPAGIGVFPTWYLERERTEIASAD